MIMAPYIVLLGNFLSRFVLGLPVLVVESEATIISQFGTDVCVCTCVCTLIVCLLFPFSQAKPAVSVLFLVYGRGTERYTSVLVGKGDFVLLSVLP